MHVELSNSPMETLKDIAKHYLMIVLGILTALGLEAWIEHAHHQHAAAATSMQIEAEIHENRQSIQTALDRDLARMHVLEKVRDGLINDIKSNVPDATIVQHVQQASPDGLYLDWRWPSLRHEAWDVAVANQSASWIDNDKLHRYTAVYAAQNAHSALMDIDVRMILDGPRMIDATVDLNTGRIQPEQLLHVVNQMWAMAEETSQNLTGLAQSIDKTMADADKATH